MKKVITTLLVSACLPLIAFAAYNDVQFTTGSILALTIGGNLVQFTTDGGNVQDVTVNNGSLSFTMAPSSAVSIYSATRSTFTTGVSQAIPSFTCGASQSTLGITLSSGAVSNEVVTVTPTGTACAQNNGGGAGSSSGNSGVGTAPTYTVWPSSAPAAASPAASRPVPLAVAPSIAAPTTPTSVASPVPVAQTVSPVFKTGLSVGSHGNDVKRLQQLLGIKSTGYFGPLTKKAITDFQKKYGLPQLGNLGPKTRAKLKEVFGK